MHILENLKMQKYFIQSFTNQRENTNILAHFLFSLQKIVYAYRIMCLYNLKKYIPEC